MDLLVCLFLNNLTFRWVELFMHFSLPSLLDLFLFHYGTKPGHFETLKIHFPMSERSERTDRRVAQYLRLDSCLFQTIVLCLFPVVPPTSLPHRFLLTPFSAFSYPFHCLFPSLSLTFPPHRFLLTPSLLLPRSKQPWADLQICLWISKPPVLFSFEPNHRQTRQKILMTSLWCFSNLFVLLHCLLCFF